MRKIFITLFLTLTAISVSSQNINKGLAIYMPMNGNAKDLTKNKNHGLVIGAKLTTDRFGKENSAYEFKRGDCCIAIESSSSLQIKDNMTISIWVNMYQTKWRGMRIVDKNTAGYGDGFCLDTYPDNGTCLRVCAADKHCIAPNPIGINNWMHIVYIFEKGNYRFYVNGKKIAEDKTLFKHINTNNLPLLLGRSQGELKGDEYFIGKMDDFRLYNRAISEKEVDLLFTEGGYVAPALEQNQNEQETDIRYIEYDIKGTR